MTTISRSFPFFIFALNLLVILPRCEWMSVEEQLWLVFEPVADTLRYWVGDQRNWFKQDFDDLFDRSGFAQWRGHIS
jgi:hypothetical protein